MEGVAKAQDLLKVENDLLALRSRVSGELTGARFLWTSGQVIPHGEAVGQALQGNALAGFIPWEAQAINGAPGVFIWRKGAAQITVRLPGLYSLTVCVFTTERAAVRVLLNDEPLFVLQPQQSAAPNTTAIAGGDYTLRRLAHSVGEVTCLSLSEHVSLPAEASLKVLFASGQPAQGFLALRKL